MKWIGENWFKLVVTFIFIILVFAVYKYFNEQTKIEQDKFNLERDKFEAQLVSDSARTECLNSARSDRDQMNTELIDWANENKGHSVDLSNSFDSIEQTYQDTQSECLKRYP
ncbi:hypothetical protein N8083_00345 [Candidatus Pacebacteria bacterium]|nr:hypothetical protein [Candidatus Paceibacterota bacterium]